MVVVVVVELISVIKNY